MDVAWRRSQGPAPLLETFAHTVGVLQTTDSLVRAARECAEDLAADGIVYAEVRYAPELHVERGLHLDGVVEAVQEGFAQGSERSGIRIGTILTAMRTAARSLEIAELAVRWRDRGVVGFDIAGAEAGYPPTRHLDAFEHVRRENFHLTIHAGEGFGVPSIWEALQLCGAERLGHGVRIVDDIEVGGRRGAAGAGRRPRPRSPRAARALPDLQRPLRCREVDRGAPDRAADRPEVPRHGQHRQPSDVGDLALAGVLAARGRVRTRLERVRRLTINAMKSRSSRSTNGSTCSTG